MRLSEMRLFVVVVAAGFLFASCATSSPGPASSESAGPEFAMAPSGAAAPMPATPAGPTPRYEGPEPCKRAVKGQSPVARGCAEGGLVRAKQVMKEMVRTGRAAGLRYNCDDCHMDDTDYSRLAKDATDKFEKLVAVSRK